MTNLVYPAISDKSSTTQQKMVDKFNASHPMADFPIGSYVMAKDQESNSVFDAKYEGPFKVARRNVGGAYQLRDATNQLLKRSYSPEQLKPVDIETNDLDSDNSYEIDHIVSHRLNNGGEWVYTVKWKGYDESHNQEVLYSDFNSKAIINQYHKKLNETNPHKLVKTVKRKRNQTERKIKKKVKFNPKNEYF